MIVANGRIAAWLDENDWQPSLDEWNQCADCPCRLLSCVVEKSFRDQRPAATDSRGDDDAPAGGQCQLCRGDRDVRLVKIGESISEEGQSRLARLCIGLKTVAFLIPP